MAAVWTTGHWQSCLHTVIVVQPGHDECQDQLLCDFLVDLVMNLMQTNMLEACSCSFSNVLFHSEFRVQMDAQVMYDTGSQPGR